MYADPKFPLSYKVSEILPKYACIVNLNKTGPRVLAAQTNDRVTSE